MLISSTAYDPGEHHDQKGSLVSRTQRTRRSHSAGAGTQADKKGRALAGRCKGLTIRGRDTPRSGGLRTDTTSSPHHCPGGFGACIPGKLNNGFGTPGAVHLFPSHKTKSKPVRFYDDVEDTRQAF